ncbi:MBL fold metallo-hydrolase [Janthinobacterium sp. CG_S6]|uniref:MBL fold metallo-hydrolase n=1 Tax=unclassified Janthinobacterium TaxID=2610881 RepID=UPI0003482FF1|nr:glyoxylase-like metal-dependent hydrolase (beta-lactamase superfamily II) [Janthinobacterium sp. CG_S6]
MNEPLYRSARTAAFFAAAVATTATMAAAPAYAAAPMAKTSAPGYFRIMLGDFEVTALSDGTVELPVNKLLTRTTPAKVDQALAQAFLSSPLETSVNAYLVNTGSKLVLIDGGAGGLFGPTLGKLLANLKASGYQPEQVDEIYLTHMHPDHVGGLAAGEQLAFPNAVVRADKHESDYWLSPENLSKAGADTKSYFVGAQASVGPYVKAGKYQSFEGNVELAPGVRSYASKGHTAGHTSYVVESKGRKLLLIGDLIHVGAVQFDHPEVTIAFDGDGKAAGAERKKAFADAAKAGFLLGASHLPFPGMGHVRAQGQAYRWVPVNYTQLR